MIKYKILSVTNVKVIVKVEYQRVGWQGCGKLKGECKWYWVKWQDRCKVSRTRVSFSENGIANSMSMVKEARRVQGQEYNLYLAQLWWGYEMRLERGKWAGPILHATFIFTPIPNSTITRWIFKFNLMNNILKFVCFLLRRVSIKNWIFLTNSRFQNWSMSLYLCILSTIENICRRKQLQYLKEPQKSQNTVAF